MNIDSIRRAIRFAGLVLPLTWAPGSMAGQMRAAQAQSFGVGVTTATVNQQAPSAVLPAGGTMAGCWAGGMSHALQMCELRLQRSARPRRWVTRSF